jgi:hypothetical protein
MMNTQRAIRLLVEHGAVQLGKLYLINARDDTHDALDRAALWLQELRRSVEALGALNVPGDAIREGIVDEAIPRMTDWDEEIPDMVVMPERHELDELFRKLFPQA